MARLLHLYPGKGKEECYEEGTKRNEKNADKDKDEYEFEDEGNKLTCQIRLASIGLSFYSSFSPIALRVHKRVRDVHHIAIVIAPFYIPLKKTIKMMKISISRQRKKIRLPIFGKKAK